MKKFVILLFLVVYPLLIFAKWDGEPVTAIMADGTRLEGYTRTSLINYNKPGVSKVGISKEFKGPETKYTSKEIAALIFPPAEGDSIYAVYEPVRAQKSMPNLWKKNPKTYKEPVFLRLIYNGEHVKGYVRACRGGTYTPSMTIVNYTWLYYYLIDGQEVAKAYWVDTNDITPAMRKVMKFYLSEFPELQKMVDDGDLTPKDFRNNPAMVLPLMDAAINSRQ